MGLIEQFSASVNTVIDSRLKVRLTQSVAMSFCISLQVVRDSGNTRFSAVVLHLAAK